MCLYLNKLFSFAKEKVFEVNLNLHHSKPVQTCCDDEVKSFAAFTNFNIAF